MPTPSVVQDHSSWKFQRSHVERLMDFAALTSAHPDDTLILAGPARLGLKNNAAPEAGSTEDFYSSLLPLGMIQNFTANLQRPLQPTQAIGSGRLFFLAGKPQGNAQIARLLVNGRNLNRALYTSVVQAGLDPSRFNDRASTPNSTYFINLDSELYLIPLGLACFFRDKVHNRIGAFYLELCMINMMNVGFNSGQAMILENVGLMFDRALPMIMPSGGNAPSGALTQSNLTEFYNTTISAQYPNTFPPGNIK